MIWKSVIVRMLSPSFLPLLQASSHQDRDSKWPARWESTRQVNLPLQYLETQTFLFSLSILAWSGNLINLLASIVAFFLVRSHGFKSHHLEASLKSDVGSQISHLDSRISDVDGSWVWDLKLWTYGSQTRPEIDGQAFGYPLEWTSIGLDGVAWFARLTKQLSEIDETGNGVNMTKIIYPSSSKPTWWIPESLFLILLHYETKWSCIILPSLISSSSAHGDTWESGHQA